METDFLRVDSFQPDVPYRWVGNTLVALDGEVLDRIRLKPVHATYIVDSSGKEYIDDESARQAAQRNYLERGFK